jgi:hypothetical protein
VCFSDILTSLFGRPSICSRVASLLVATHWRDSFHALGGSLFGVPSTDRGSRLRDMSNFCCLPGRAGGTPLLVSNNGRQNGHVVMILRVGSISQIKAKAAGRQENGEAIPDPRSSAINPSRAVRSHPERQRPASGGCRPHSDDCNCCAGDCSPPRQPTPLPDARSQSTFAWIYLISPGFQAVLLPIPAVNSGSGEEAGTSDEAEADRLAAAAASSFPVCLDATTGRRSACTGFGTNRAADTTPPSDCTEMVCG